jgi:hypothetical protein
MTPRQFAAALAGTRMPPDSASSRAARLVLVDGLSMHAAARECGIGHSAVSRAVARIQPRETCPTCGGSGKLAATAIVPAAR